MKRFISFAMVLSLLFILCSCGRYTGSYKAVGLHRSRTSHSCETSFQSLKGHLVCKIKKSDKGNEGKISFSVQVDKGEIYIYYDAYGVKEELIHVKAGESIENIGGYVEGGKTVYIIIDAPEYSEAKISVELDN